MSTNNNQTNPLVISATGYAPYIKARADRASAKGTFSKADRRAQAIRDYWVRQDNIQEISEYAAQHEKDLLRSQWECALDKKDLYSRVQREVGKVMGRMDEELERRRNRLSELLKSEEEMYLAEGGRSQEEDPESRNEKMMSRYMELKLQKEIEREKIVAEKREQQFKRNCGELRTLVSRKLQRETAEEGRQMSLERLRTTSESREREEKMYEELWVRDCEVKRQREEEEAEEKRSKERQYGQYVAEQIQERKLERSRELREKEADAEILAEQKRLLGLEEEWEKEMKKRKQADTKRDLDECLREKLKRKGKEVQDDIFQDIYFLRQIMEDEEGVKRNAKKRALMQEQKQYLQYLEDQMRRELEFEKDVDRMYQRELDKVWDRRQREWDEEKEKRRRRERDVIDGVKDQIADNMERDRAAQSLNKEHAQMVVQENERDKRREAEKLRLIRERNAKHQRELLEQIKMKEDKLLREKSQRDYELEVLQRAREEEEEKIRNILSEMKIDNEHPYRECRSGIFNNCND